MNVIVFAFSGATILIGLQFVFFLQELAAAQQYFCFAHTSNALMTGMSLKVIHHHFCPYGGTKVPFKLGDESKPSLVCQNQPLKYELELIINVICFVILITLPVISTCSQQSLSEKAIPLSMSCLRLPTNGINVFVVSLFIDVKRL